MDLALGNSLLLAVGESWLEPLWMIAAGAAGAVVVLYGLIFLLQLVAPRVVAVARTTAKEALSQPLFYVLLAIGTAAILLFPFVPYNTFGEDVKMLEETGMTLIKVLAIVLALWTASVSIADEIEGRTALTLLSKPIGRVRFILGKFLGIVWPVAIVFIILGALFLASVSYKVVYDAREVVSPEPTSQQCINEMVKVLPGLALAFLEAVVLASISVAISTRLPMIPNLVICISIYVLGHLVTVMVNSAVGQFEIVRFVGQFMATLLPVLSHYGMEGAIMKDASPLGQGAAVPWPYLAWATLYAALYSTMAMLVALLLFEDRDLA